MATLTMAALSMAMLTAATLTAATQLRLHLLWPHLLWLHLLWWLHVHVPWPPAAQRVLPGGRCHQNDIVREFRLFYPRYRRHDTGVAHKLPPALQLCGECGKCGECGEPAWPGCLAWLQGVRQPAARQWHATATARHAASLCACNEPATPACRPGGTWEGARTAST